jgi:putative transposase
MKKIDKKYKTNNRSKHFLFVHIIFSTKYRKPILKGNFDVFIKNEFMLISNNSDFDIENIETDKDHVHFLIRYIPKLSIASIVNRLKAISTKNAYKCYESKLRRYYYYDNLLWSDGYFASTVGDVDLETINKYIHNQKSV